MNIPMDESRYLWRRLNDSQRKELLEVRQRRRHPWHSPPHRASEHFHYHVSAACYEHQPHIGRSPERMETFTEELLHQSREDAQEYVVVWCVLPNHYHLLVATDDILAFLHGLGKLHGRTSFRWNGEEQARGRKVWFNATERALRTEAHYWATVNYVHHNPVRHGYVKKWEDWPFSSARDYLEAVGREKALKTWFSYPVLNYGRGWDEPGV